MEIMTKILIIAISVILPGSLYLLFINRNIIRQIRHIPIYLLKDLPARGKVAFIGNAKTNILISPITKNQCAYFNCYVQELKYFGDDHDPHRITIYKESSKEPLIVSDDTGSIQVNPNCAKLILKPNFQETMSSDTHQVVRTNLSELGINLANDQVLEKSYFVYEEIISAGDSLYILGYVRQIDRKHIITNKWNQRIIISNYNQADLLKMYIEQLNQIKQYTPVILIMIIIGLLFLVFFCKWPLP